MPYDWDDQLPVLGKEMVEIETVEAYLSCVQLIYNHSDHHLKNVAVVVVVEHHDFCLNYKHLHCCLSPCSSPNYKRTEEGCNHWHLDWYWNSILNIIKFTGHVIWYSFVQ